jgi:hypothetical protein
MRRLLFKAIACADILLFRLVLRNQHSSRILTYWMRWPSASSFHAKARRPPTDDVLECRGQPVDADLLRCLHAHTPSFKYSRQVMRLVVVAALFQAMVWVPTAHAAANQDGAKAEADKDAARSEWRRGTTAYDLGRYEEAASHYEAAYTLVQDPGFLFNIAQSYRMGGRLSQALERYRAFLRNASVDAPNRGTAEKFVEEIKRKLEEKKEVVAITSPETTPAKEPALPEPTPTPAGSPAGIAAAGSIGPVVPPAPPIAVPVPSAGIAAAGSTGAAAPPTPPIAVPVPSSVDGTTTLTSPLAPEQTSVAQPIYKTWWFWTGVGAVVVAGTVTALLLTHRSSSPCSGTGLNCWEVK